MSLDKYGELGTQLKRQIDESAREIIGEIIEPVRVLPQHLEEKTVFSLDDLCSILGYALKDKQKIREACQRGEIPFQQIGRDYIFPKPMIVAFLLGDWKKGETKKQAKPPSETPKSKRDRKILNFASK